MGEKLRSAEGPEKEKSDQELTLDFPIEERLAKASDQKLEEILKDISLNKERGVLSTLYHESGYELSSREEGAIEAELKRRKEQDEK